MAPDARRELIVRAAAGRFADSGYAATRLDQIALDAGVTKPVIYRHFESKKALYLALLERHREDLPGFFAYGDPGFAGGDSEVAIRAILDHWLDYVRANSHAWLMLFRDGSGDGEIREFRLAVSARAREVIAAFIRLRAGSQIPSAEVEPTAQALTSGLTGLALWWIDHPEVEKAIVLETAARISFAALAR